MKLKRKGGKDDEFLFYFRLVGVSKAISDSFDLKFPDVDDKPKRIQKDPTKFVIFIPLEDDLISSQDLRSFIQEHNISEKNYGVWVSIISEFESGGLTLPKKISKFYLDIGGTFDISYTIY